MEQNWNLKSLGELFKACMFINQSDGIDFAQLRSVTVRPSHKDSINLQAATKSRRGASRQRDMDSP